MNNLIKLIQANTLVKKISYIYLAYIKNPVR